VSEPTAATLLGGAGVSAIVDVFGDEEWADLIPLEYRGMLAAAILGALTAPVAALLAKASTEGEERGRGDMAYFEEKWRADERERIARRISAAKPAGAQQLTFEGGLRLAARIARSTSDGAR
jgi:hypothetical protein